VWRSRVARSGSAVGVVCVNWQQVCLGVAAAGHNVDVWVTDEVLQFYDGNQLLRTSARTSEGTVRVKRSRRSPAPTPMNHRCCPRPQMAALTYRDGKPLRARLNFPTVRT
jgi:hypothetical protein